MVVTIVSVTITPHIMVNVRIPFLFYVLNYCEVVPGTLHGWLCGVLGVAAARCGGCSGP
jgi:hypothetical protein